MWSQAKENLRSERWIAPRKSATQFSKTMPTQEMASAKIIEAFGPNALNQAVFSFCAGPLCDLGLSRR